MSSDKIAAKPKARALGINHVVLEVGDLDEALAFYGNIFDFELRKRNETQAFIDMGDAEGARSSLEEVLTEGTDDQKAEATGLLDQIN